MPGLRLGAYPRGGLRRLPSAGLRVLEVLVMDASYPSGAPYAPGSLHKEEQPIIRNRVKAMRRQRGLSRREMADAVGMNPRTLGYIEHQEIAENITLSTVYKLADYLGAKPYELFYRCDGQLEPISLYEPEPPNAVQEYAGGRKPARILVTLLDRGPLQKRKIGESTKVQPQELEEYLGDLCSTGLLQTTENDLALLRKDEKVLFCLTMQSRTNLAKAFREDLRKS